MSKHQRLGNAIKVTKYGIYFGKEAYENLGKPERVSILYDVSKKAIKIETNQGDRQVQGRKYPSYYILTITLYKVMPVGLYKHKKDNIFKLSEEAVNTFRIVNI